MRLPLRRRRGSSLVLKFVVAGIVPLAMALAFAGWDGARQAKSRDLARAQSLAHAGADKMSAGFGEWRSLLLVASGNQAFATAAGEVVSPAKIDAIHTTVSLLHEQYPDLIDEICVITNHGLERARSVFGTFAAESDLSPDESGNPFFTPTLALQKGHVYQAPPYVSPDSNRWVISNSTPIDADNGGRVLLHFEVSLEAVRQRLSTLVGSDARARIVDTATGNVLVDTAGNEVTKLPFETADKLGRLGGRMSTYDIVGGADNANHWQVQVSVPPSPFLTPSSLMELGALILFALTGLVLIARRNARSIADPLRRMAAASASLADGDLTVVLAEDGDREVAAASHAFGRATARFASAVQAMSVSSHQLRASSADLEHTNQLIVDDASRTMADAASAAGLSSIAQLEVGEVTIRARQNLAAVDEIASEADHVAQLARDAEGAMGAAVDAVDDLATATADVVTAVHSIAEIAEQTNLLALNATIEASRAGDAGRGFTVVASNVKDLASETGRATKAITERISVIQADGAAVAAAITRVNGVIAQIAQGQQMVAAATAQQRSASDEIDRKLATLQRQLDEITAVIDRFATVAASTQGRAGESLDSSRALSAMADELGRLVSQFRV